MPAEADCEPSLLVCWFGGSELAVHEGSGRAVTTLLSSEGTAAPLHTNEALGAHRFMVSKHLMGLSNYWLTM